METAVRRLGVVSNHVVLDDEAQKRDATPEERQQHIAMRHHGVFLPEDLRSDAPWNVVRSDIAQAPRPL